MATQLSSGSLSSKSLSSKSLSSKSIARLAGLFYLGLIIAGIFAHAYVREAMVYVPGDAAATASNIVDHETLARFGVLADLIGAASFLFVGFAVHRLFRHLNKDAANALVTLVAIAVGMTCLNMIFQVGGIITATDPTYLEGLGADGANALSLLMFDLQYYGYILLQVFTGLWLLPFGYLILRSNGFPKLFGWLIVLGGFCYLADLGLHVMAPDTASDISLLVLTPAILGEFLMVGYFLVRGVGANFIEPTRLASEV